LRFESSGKIVDGRARESLKSKLPSGSYYSRIGSLTKVHFSPG